MEEFFPIAPHGAQLFRFRPLRAGSILICALVALAFLVLPVIATAPEASFVIYPGYSTSGTAPFTVKFKDTSTNTPTSWSWTFGDGSTSTSQHPSHKYTEVGTYTVTLTVTNADGSDDYARSNYITIIEEKPEASFTSDVKGGIVPLTVQFEDTSENNPTSWSWTFGDGDTSTEKDPQHTYTTKGTYTVVLKVTNSGGTDTMTKSSYITVVKASDPVASFKSDVTSGTAPLTVKFTDTSTYYPDSWEWDFGDDETSDDQNPEHKYDKEGTYTVTLTVSNSEGEDTIKKKDYITVGNKPVISFTATPVSGTAPLTVAFKDTSTYSPDTWYWAFGDGYSSTSQNPSHTYSNPGSYSITLTATNDVGSNSVTKSSFITVSAVTTAPTTTVPTTVKTTVKTTATTAAVVSTATTAAPAAEENTLFSLPVIAGIVIVIAVIAGVFFWKGGRGGRGGWDL